MCVLYSDFVAVKRIELTDVDNDVSTTNTHYYINTTTTTTTTTTVAIDP